METMHIFSHSRSGFCHRPRRNACWNKADERPTMSLIGIPMMAEMDTTFRAKQEGDENHGWVHNNTGVQGGRLQFMTKIGVVFIEQADSDA